MLAGRPSASKVTAVSTTGTVADGVSVTSSGAAATMLMMVESLILTPRSLVRLAVTR